MLSMFVIEDQINVLNLCGSDTSLKMYSSFKGQLICLTYSDSQVDLCLSRVKHIPALFSIWHFEDSPQIRSINFSEVALMD